MVEGSRAIVMGFISANDQKISRETFETYFQTLKNLCA